MHQPNKSYRYKKQHTRILAYPSDRPLGQDSFLHSMQIQSSQHRFTAYYKKTLGLLFLIVGAVGLLTSLYLIIQGSMLPLLAVLCLLLCLFGLYCLRRPYFLLEPRQLTVYNLLGITTRRYTFESWEFVKADNRRIYIDDNGITKKVPVAPWLVKTDDWLAMRSLL